nr:hypothetical protein Iba_chr05eCG11120 [Ipomoea batatas]
MSTRKENYTNLSLEANPTKDFFLLESLVFLLAYLCDFRLLTKSCLKSPNLKHKILLGHFLHYFRWITRKGIITGCTIIEESGLFFSICFINRPPTKEPGAMVNKCKAITKPRREQLISSCNSSTSK